MPLILHHYPQSPFAEIVRLALGLKGLAWSSVIQPIVMPRPTLTPLTGGYRRIPVLQIGADVYCDTAVILMELERRFPTPPLTPPDQAGLGWLMRNWVERVWFQATVGVVFGAIGAHTPEAFIKDREALSGRPFDPVGMAAAAPSRRAHWRAFAEQLEAQLADGRAFLMGPQPGLADLSTVMPVWWLHTAVPPVYDQLTVGLGGLRAWRARVAEIGHGAPTDLDGADAVAAAAAADPAPPLPSAPESQGLAPGMAVTVAADDYGRDPITGVITAVDSQRIALRRDTPEAGPVVVHLPRAGFVVAG